MVDLTENAPPVLTGYCDYMQSAISGGGRSGTPADTRATSRPVTSLCHGGDDGSCCGCCIHYTAGGAIWLLRVLSIVITHCLPFQSALLLQLSSALPFFSRFIYYSYLFLAFMMFCCQYCFLQAAAVISVCQCSTSGHCNCSAYKNMPLTQPHVLWSTRAYEGKHCPNSII